MVGVLGHCTSSGLPKGFGTGAQERVCSNVNAFTVRSVGSRAGSAMSRVETTGIRQELRLYDAAVHDKQTLAKREELERKNARLVPRCRERVVHTTSGC